MKKDSLIKEKDSAIPDNEVGHEIKRFCTSMYYVNLFVFTFGFVIFIIGFLISLNTISDSEYFGLTILFGSIILVLIGIIGYRIIYWSYVHKLGYGIIVQDLDDIKKILEKK